MQQRKWNAKHATFILKIRITWASYFGFGSHTDHWNEVPGLMGSKQISSHEAMKPCASHVHMATPEAADPSCSIYSNLSNAAVYRQRSSKWISSKRTTLSLIYLLCTWRNTESSECRHLFRRFSAFYNTHENKAEVFFMQAVQYYFFLGRKSLGDKRSAI